MPYHSSGWSPTHCWLKRMRYSVMCIPSRRWRARCPPSPVPRTADAGTTPIGTSSPLARRRPTGRSHPGRDCVSVEGPTDSLGSARRSTRCRELHPQVGVAAVAERVLREVLLVVVLGVEVRRVGGRADLGGDGAEAPPSSPRRRRRGQLAGDLFLLRGWSRIAERYCADVAAPGGSPESGRTSKKVLTRSAYETRRVEDDAHGLGVKLVAPLHTSS